MGTSEATLVFDHAHRLVVVALAAALGSTACNELESTCDEVAVGAPYAAGLPYVGVHANPQNNDLAACSIPEHWEQQWHVLQGRAMGQPATLSPDAATVYVTTSMPGGPDDCSVFALDAETGEQRWCLAEPGAINSSVEADADGHLYLTSDAGVLSLDAGGGERWRRALSDEPGIGAIGLHFTPAGHIATVNRDGLLALVDRGSGEILASLDLPAATGFTAPPVPDIEGLEDFIPDTVFEDFEALYGEVPTDGTFGGLSGHFTENTVAVAPDGSLYVTGAGATEHNGTVIQVRVDEGASPPTMAVGFHVELGGFSAASPVVSPDGRWLKITDGVRAVSYPTPAKARLVEIGQCPDSGPCEPAIVIDLGNGALAGSSPVLDGVESYHWLTRLGTIWDEELPDVVAHDGEAVRWEAFLPDEMVWSSPITLTDELVIGGATALTPSSYEIYGWAWPGTAESELVVLSRETGEVIFRAPLPDDASTSVTVAPDGSLYASLLALLSTTASSTRPVAGVVRFTPARE